MRKSIKLLCLVLATALLSGCSLLSEDEKEKHTRDTRVKNGFIANEKPAIDFKTPRDEAILSAMTLTMENEHLQLYFGKYYDIAVLDKQTGKVYFSGDALYDKEGRLEKNSMYNYAASQLSVEYYDKNNLMQTKTSYPDCYLDEAIQQIIPDRGSDYVRLTYCLGQRNDQYVIPYVLTGETYTRLKAEAENMAKEGQLTKNASGQFIKAYKKVTVSTLSEAEKEQMSKKYENIALLGTIYEVMPSLTNKVKAQVSSVCVALGVDAAMIDEQIELVGVNDLNTDSVYSNESDYFVIPVVYRFDGGDLVVTVETEKIEASKSAYLSKVSLLNSFAGNKVSEEGYLFLPDGSGTVIDNGASVYGQSQLQVPFYGHNFALSYDSFDALEAYSSMPVFGIKSNGAAVFAIVESGDAIGGVMGRAGITAFPYACAYPYFNYYVRDYLNRTANVYAYSKVLPTEAFTVRYHFLYAADADYSGMARYYRDYLEWQGVLCRLTDTADLRLNIRLFGAINKRMPILGVPVKQVVSTTSFEQAREIIDALDQAGIRNLDVIYTEIMNGAREYKAPSKLAIEKSLGGMAGYNELVRYAANLGYRVFPGVDFGRVVKKGNGIQKSEDLILRISRDEAGVYNDYVVPSGTVLPLFVDPQRYSGLVCSFIADYHNLEGGNVYLQTLGYYLSANYNEKDGLTRTESQILTVKAMEDLTDASLKLKMDGGTRHALPYADSLINVELESGRPRLEKHSVPFVAMVLKGYIPFTGAPLNNSGEYEKELLKMLENGADMYYEIMAEDSFILADTDYTDMYSVGASIWLDDIIEKYRQLQAEMKGLANTRLDSHRQLTEDVFETVYEDGTRVIVNYSDQAYQGIEPLKYRIIHP